MAETNLYSLIYLSTVADTVDDAVLEDIRAVAEKRNGRDGITGVLYFNGRNFVQMLEGPRTVVTGLMDDIAEDLRHYGVAVLMEGETDRRHFPDWHMQTFRVSPDPVRRKAEIADSLPDGMEGKSRDLLVGFGALA